MQVWGRRGIATFLSWESFQRSCSTHCDDVTPGLRVSSSIRHPNNLANQVKQPEGILWLLGCICPPRLRDRVRIAGLLQLWVGPVESRVPLLRKAGRGTTRSNC